MILTNSLTRKLESRVRNPLETRKSVFFSVFVFCVGSGLATGRSPIQGTQPIVYKCLRFIINSEWKQAREINSSILKKRKNIDENKIRSEKIRSSST
jgi:hypothetical protein